MRIYTILFILTVCLPAQFVSASQLSHRVSQTQEDNSCQYCLETLPKQCFYTLKCSHAPYCAPCTLKVARAGNNNTKRCTLCTKPFDGDMVEKIKTHANNNRKHFSNEQLQKIFPTRCQAFREKAHENYAGLHDNLVETKRVLSIAWNERREIGRQIGQEIDQISFGIRNLDPMSKLVLSQGIAIITCGAVYGGVALVKYSLSD